MDGKVEDSPEIDPSEASQDAPVAVTSSLEPTRVAQGEDHALPNGTAPRSAESAGSDPEPQAALPGTPTIRFKRQDSGSKGKYKVPGLFPPSLS